MTYTNFPGGVTSFGIPMIGGLNGIPLTGKWWFCDYANGSDGNATAGSDGAPPDSPLKTISYAHSIATAGRNDVVVIMGDGSTTASQRLTTSLTWSKNATHLIGMTAPAMDAQRARITTLSAATLNLAPLMTISANGCIFANFSYFQGVGQSSTAECLLDISGQRNWFGNVQFGGIGSANGGGQSGSYIIKFISGGAENLFEHCSIGLETEPRTTTNTSVWLSASNQRNQFRDCEFSMYPKAATPLFVKVDASALGGSTLKFTRCAFKALISATGGTQPSVTGTFSATQNGDVYFDQCSTIAAKWAAAATNVHVTGPAANGFSGGVFTNAADA